MNIGNGYLKNMHFIILQILLFWTKPEHIQNSHQVACNSVSIGHANRVG